MAEYIKELERYFPVALGLFVILFGVSTVRMLMDKPVSVCPSIPRKVFCWHLLHPFRVARRVLDSVRFWK